MRYLLFCLIALMLVGCTSGSTDTEEDVIARDRAWAAAVVGKDWAALEQIISPEMIYCHSSGQLDTAEVYMNTLRSGASDYQVIDISTISAKLFGDTAVVNARANFRVLVTDNLINNSLAYTHVYKKIDGNWRMISHQAARLNPAS
jgi:ketosteroid isomerase-like protein